ncbi:MAG: DUF1284 domain-containing protein [Oscillospiraceae bacterium]|nr:DUF1284 domain-containing protein [Oscillospiraceae bacterium]
MSSFELRPHHGLCIAFFEGKGYSSDFIKNMTDKIRYLNTDNPEIRLVLHTDSICSACPHNQNRICISSQKVLCYDKTVLHFCGLQENHILLWKEFQNLVFLNILRKGRLSAVCKQCQWLQICSEKSAAFLTSCDKYDKIDL